MKISLMKKFDQLGLMDKSETEMWRAIDTLFPDIRDLIESVDFFITHLPANHDMSGKEWNQLIDIGEVAKKYKTVTVKQRRLVGVIIGSNWQKMQPTQEFMFV